MSTEIKVPTLPESVADATVVTWHKKAGDSVTRDEVLVEIETDKVVLEVPAPCDGTLQTIAQEEGATVVADQVLGQVGEGAANTSTAAPATDTSANNTAASTGSSESVALNVPTLPESVADATVVNWSKKVGDSVSRDEILVEIETDKVVLEVPSPADGVLQSIEQDVGSTVTAEQLLGSVAAGASAVATAPTADTTSASTADDELLVNPAARKMIAENNLNAADIKGTGKGGRILKEDVQAFLAAPKTAAAPAPTSKPAPVAVSAEGERPAKRVPMTRIRKRIAERLLDASQNTAMLTTFNEVDMKPFMDFRNKYKDAFMKRHDVKLGLMSIFVKAAAEALDRYPDINASIDGDDLVYHGFADIGVAVSTDDGLVVPVLRSVEDMGIADIENGVIDFAKKARAKKLSMDDMSGGTFTITNGGVFGSMLSTPILNPPQSAILGLHNIVERAVVVDGEIVVRPIMYIALSYDHRVVDGKGAVGFLKTIKDLVEDPMRLVFDI